jgi:hypothetical protein
MAKTLSKTGITTGNTVQPGHVTQSVDAFTGIEAYDISLSGSFNMTGSINGEPGVTNSLTASYAITASYTATSSYAVTSSFATTASYAENAGGSPSYYNLNFTNTQDSPSDNRTYYIGNSYRLPITTGTATPPKAMIAGTITEAFLSANIGTPGTDQTTKVTILNIDTNLSSSVGDMVHNDYTTYVSASLSPGLTVNAGDRIVFQIVTPTWATNPLGVTHTGYVLIQI